MADLLKAKQIRSGHRTHVKKLIGKISDVTQMEEAKTTLAALAKKQIILEKCDSNILEFLTLDVIILQIQTGCEGLNLQHFQEIYFVSPHWNPAVEAQAVARCHRIGQEAEVDVFRFTMEAIDDVDTLDMCIKKCQERKLELLI